MFYVLPSLPSIIQATMDYVPDDDRALETAYRCPKKQARRINASSDKSKNLLFVFYFI